jgi:ABC-type antimicrobial peptide transport system permease subunit
MIRKSRTISIAAIASLALGIGATTAIYSLADTILWRKLAVPNPEQIVELLWETKGRSEGLMRNTSGSSFPDGALRVSDFFSSAAFETIRQRSAGQLQVSAHIHPEEVSCVYRGNVTVAQVRPVDRTFFDTLQLRPFAGRLFEANSDGPEVVVSYSFWERTLGSSDKAIGETIRLNNRPFLVSGVLPRSFTGMSPGDGVELYTTLAQRPSNFVSDTLFNAQQDDPFRWWMQLIVRRSPDVSMTQAHTLIDSAFAASWPAQPKSPEQTPRLRLVDASTGLGGLRRQLGSPVASLLGLASLVLLVACANIANLLLARSAEREKEVSVRVSLGCGSKRLMRQFLTESLLLALLGGGLSVAVGAGIGMLMETVLPAGLNTSSMTLELDFDALNVTLGVTVITALVFGLYPA